MTEKPGPAPVDRPTTRSPLRSLLGKEFYILKRRLRWLRDSAAYARAPGGKVPEGLTPHSFIRHRSLLLRSLKDVDMYLQHNKVKNLSLAIARIDGTVLLPGQRMSVWKLVGRPTRRKGYLDGLVLHNGKTGKGVGGGLCQLGNLLYWMALHTELEVTERWRHSFDVFPDVNRTIPFGCSATLSYNYIDLEITNNTPDIWSVRLWLDDEYLNGEILCSAPPSYRYEIVEADHRIVHQWWGGYTRHNRIIKRRTGLPDGIVLETPVAENHAVMMYNPLLEGGG
ncbi:MAG: VanW family protein [Alistipes sp.]|nr:VanW family protein [Alistipes sp.]